MSALNLAGDNWGELLAMVEGMTEALVKCGHTEFWPLMHCQRRVRGAMRILCMQAPTWKTLFE